MTLDATIATALPGPGAAVVTINGHLDTYSAPDVRAALIDAINEGRYRQVVDLTAVTFLDSTGLAVIVGAVKRARAHGGDLVLAVDLEGRTGKVLRITGLHKSIEVRHSVEDALECLAAPTATA